MGKKGNIDCDVIELYESALDGNLESLMKVWDIFNKAMAGDPYADILACEITIYEDQKRIEMAEAKKTSSNSEAK